MDVRERQERAWRWDVDDALASLRVLPVRRLLVAGRFLYVTMDVKSANPLGYNNTGIQALRNALDPLGLIAIRREQLHYKREYSRGGNTRNGYTSTRIDRWYVPDIDELIMTAGLTNEFVYKDRPSDHMGMWLRVEDRTSKE